ncbi:MAG: hypothetical protein MJ066_02700 [Clostridia bacterium]|nr:hypothetical protein [Clostridia bacterium]
MITKRTNPLELNVSEKKAKKTQQAPVLETKEEVKTEEVATTATPTEKVSFFDKVKAFFKNVVAKIKNLFKKKNKGE